MKLSKLCICAGIVLAGFQALAADPIRVVTENFPPFNYEENGVVKGTATEVVKAVLEDSKLPHDIKVLPWTRAYTMASSEPNVMIYTLVRIPPREDQFKWIRPIGNGGRSMFFKLKSDPNTYASLEAAKKVNVIVYRDGMDHHMATTSKFPNVNVASNVSSAIKMFMSKRAPLLIFDEETLEETLVADGFALKDVEPVMPFFTRQPYFAMSKSTPDATVQLLQASYDKLVKAKKIPAYK